MSVQQTRSKMKQLYLFKQHKFFNQPYLDEPPDDHTCVECMHTFKYWKRRMSGPAVKALCLLVYYYKRMAKPGPLHYDVFLKALQPAAARSAFGNFNILTYWRFVKPLDTDDPSKRSSGFYTPTNSGIQFADNKLKVYSHVITCENTFEAWSGEKVCVYDVLPKGFDWQQFLVDNRIWLL